MKYVPPYHPADNTSHSKTTQQTGTVRHEIADDKPCLSRLLSTLYIHVAPGLGQGYPKPTNSFLIVPQRVIDMDNCCLDLEKWVTLHPHTPWGDLIQIYGRSAYQYVNAVGQDEVACFRHLSSLLDSREVHSELSDCESHPSPEPAADETWIVPQLYVW